MVFFLLKLPPPARPGTTCTKQPIHGLPRWKAPDIPRLQWLKWYPERGVLRSKCFFKDNRMIFCIKLNHWTVSAVSCSVAVGGRPCQSFCKLDTCHRNFAVNFGEFLSNWCLREPFWMSWEKKNRKRHGFLYVFCLSCFIIWNPSKTKRPRLSSRRQPAIVRTSASYCGADDQLQTWTCRREGHEN